MPHRLQLDGSIEIYRSKKHLLNFTKDLKKINFHKISEYADFHDWYWYLCHGDGCCTQLRHVFYVLVYKKELTDKLNQNPNFIPDVEKTSLGRINITKKEALKLQEIILELNLKKFLNDIKFPRSLAYLGVAMYTIGKDVENENKKITQFLISEFKKIINSIKNKRLLYILQNDEIIIENLKKLDDIYYNGLTLTCWDLEIFEKILERIKLQNPKNNLAI